MQAFLITAYKDEQQLIKLISRLNVMGNVYVHIDKKSKEIDINRLRKLELTNVHFFSKYKIYWASVNHVYAVLDLMRIALSNPQNEYFHIISGQDYPVKSCEDFEEKFNEKCHEIYMSCSGKNIYNEGVVERFRYWYPITKRNPKTLWVRGINKVLLSIQKVLGISFEKIGEFADIYKGMIYVSGPRDAFEYVLDYFDTHRDFAGRIKHIRIAEEFVFQTILMNSKFGSDIVPSNLRYNDWENGNGMSPAFLSEESFQSITEGEFYFARKLESGTSDRLIQMIDLRVDGK